MDQNMALKSNKNILYNGLNFSPVQLSCTAISNLSLQIFSLPIMSKILKG